MRLACAFLAVSASWFWLARSRAAARRRWREPRTSRWWRRAAVVCSFLVLRLGLSAHRVTTRRPCPDTPRDRTSSTMGAGCAYLETSSSSRRSFRHARARARVLATLDHELAVWWIGTQGGAVLPRPVRYPLPTPRSNGPGGLRSREQQIPPIRSLRRSGQRSRAEHSYGHKQHRRDSVFGAPEVRPVGWTLRIPRRSQAAQAVYREQADVARTGSTACALRQRRSLGLNPDPKIRARLPERHLRLYVHVC